MSNNRVIGNNNKLIWKLSLEEALLLKNNDCFIIGGEIYKQSLEIADKIYLTLVNKDDTSFPELNGTWVKIEVKEFKSDDNNEYDYSFIEYERYQF